MMMRLFQVDVEIYILDKELVGRVCMLLIPFALHLLRLLSRNIFLSQLFQPVVCMQNRLIVYICSCSLGHQYCIPPLKFQSLVPSPHLDIAGLLINLELDK